MTPNEEGRRPKACTLPLVTLPTGANHPGQLVTLAFSQDGMNAALNGQFEGNMTDADR